MIPRNQLGTPGNLYKLRNLRRLELTTMSTPATRRAMRLFPRKSTQPATANGQRLTTATASHRRTGRAAAAVARSLTSATGRAPTAQTASQNETSLTTALRTVISTLPPGDIADFIDTVTGADDELDPALWGPPPSPAEAARAHLVNLAARFADRQSVLAHSITRAEAAHLLGISDQAVSDRLAAGDLVGLKDGRIWKLPAWQFDADTPNGWLPGIADLRQHFPAGPVTLTAWVTTPNVDLDEQTPAARLAAGDVAHVLRAAQANGPAAW